MDKQLFSIAMPERSSDDTAERYLTATVDGSPYTPELFDAIPAGVQASGSGFLRLPNSDGVVITVGFPAGAVVDLELVNVDNAGNKSTTPSVIEGWEISDDNPPSDPGELAFSYVREVHSTEANGDGSGIDTGTDGQDSPADGAGPEGNSPENTSNDSQEDPTSSEAA